MRLLKVKNFQNCITTFLKKIKIYYNLNLDFLLSVKKPLTVSMVSWFKPFPKEFI